MRSFKIYLLVGFLVACNSVQVNVLDGDGTRSAASVQLERFLADYWEYELERNPTLATSSGDHRYDDRYSDYGNAQFRLEGVNKARELLLDIEQIDSSALSGQDLLSYELFIRDQQQTLDNSHFPSWLMPVGRSSTHSSLMRLGAGTSSQPFETAEDYRRWFKRLAHIVPITETQIANMREGVATGVSLPRAVVPRSVAEFEKMVVDDVEDSLLWKSMANIPDTIPQVERDALTKEYRSLLTNEVMPAYRRMLDFLRDEYVPGCRETAGMVHMPNGQAWYASRIKRYTTTDMTAEEIHEYGLQEVARLHDEIRGVMKTVGFEGDLQDFFTFLKTDEQFFYKTKADMFADFERTRKIVRPLLEASFDIFPKADFEIRPVEAYREEAASSASYRRASPDGSRPGVFYLNTVNLEAQPIYRREALYLHEAEPGHHFAGSVQSELSGLPKFRTLGSYTVFSEGWGLYAESLGQELGLYTDPYQYYGALYMQLYRSMRLVVDTGMHHFGWERERAIDYMLTNSSFPRAKVEQEVDRYLFIPGQALSYKIGQREIRNMRSRAETDLGEKFDIKAFHRQILIDGALPMDVLAAKIARWVSAQL